MAGGLQLVFGKDCPKTNWNNQNFTGKVQINMEIPNENFYLMNTIGTIYSFFAVANSNKLKNLFL